jgi:hypothetical protein
MNTEGSRFLSHSLGSLRLFQASSNSELCGFFSSALRSIFRVSCCSSLVIFPRPGLRLHLVVSHRVPIPPTRYLLNCPSCGTFVADHISSAPQVASGFPVGHEFPSERELDH